MAVPDSHVPVHTWVTKIATFWREGLWQEDGGVKEFFLKSLRIFILSVRGLTKNRSLIRASALAYLTGLAIIPLLALLFAILKSLGIQRLLAAPLLANLAPGSQDFALQILHYIETTQVASLGVFGIVALLADLIILMTNVEWAFNDIWQVGRTRPWRRKLSDYLSIFLIFPLLIAVAISITTNFLSHPYIMPWLAKILPEALLTSTSGLFSLGLFWLAFTFIYLVMPNTRVRFFSALIGGLVGAFFWQVAQMLLAWIHAQASFYNAIYGVVYHLLFFSLWLYWSWLIVLFGSEVAYSHQNLQRLSMQWRQPDLRRDPVDEYVALAALVAISERFLRRRPLLSLDDLDLTLANGDRFASRVVNTLKEMGLVLEVAPSPEDGTPRYAPAVPLDQVTVGTVLDDLRQARMGTVIQGLEKKPGLADLMHRLAENRGASPWEALSLQEVVQQTASPPETSG